MASSWTPEQLQQIGDSRELEIASRRPDGSLRSFLPIWVVCAGDEVYVRTWYRRTTGWFGHVVASGQARVRVPGVESDVVIEDLGDRDPELRAAVDQAYRDKYGPSDDGAVTQMISDEATQTTLRLSPADQGQYADQRPMARRDGPAMRPSRKNRFFVLQKRPADLLRASSRRLHELTKSPEPSICAPQC